MNQFYINGEPWRIIFVNHDSNSLIDRTGRRTLATTDPYTHYVCLSNRLRGPMLRRVLTHEVGHCAMISYGLLDDIHRMVRPQYWLEAEEWICNYILDYGTEIQSIVNSILY